jgi:PmbA protein
MNELKQQDRPAAWSPVAADEQENQLLEVADLALAHAESMGASAAEASLGHGSGSSITVRNGEVETVEHNRDKSLGITVYFGHRSGNASTTDFSRAAVEACVEAAGRIARYTEEDPYNGLADPALLAREIPDLDLYHPWDVSVEEAIDIARRCEQAALSADDRISNTEGGSLSSHQGADLYANSNGFRGLSRSSRHSISCSVIAGQGDGMQRDYWYDSQRDRRLLASAEEVGRETARRTLRRLEARKGETRSCPIVFEAPVAASLLSHLTTAISGTSLYRKSSFLTDSLGKQLFPSSVRIHEQPLLRGAAGSASFDNEGVATRSRDIVTEGVLQSYLLGSYSARKLGMETTGNAGGVHNLTIDPTVEGGLEELLRQMGSGLLVTELIGYGINNVTGDYSRGAFGFLVENGEITEPVQEMTIAGNLRDMFMALEVVGADVDERRNMRTGSILIGKMTVAGE